MRLCRRCSAPSSSNLCPRGARHATANWRCYTDCAVLCRITCVMCSLKIVILFIVTAVCFIVYLTATFNSAIRCIIAFLCPDVLNVSSILANHWLSALCTCVRNNLLKDLKLIIAQNPSRNFGRKFLGWVWRSLWAPALSPCHEQCI